jgi:pSer/pThr/pTyr-binding forkhead associated (FHA) protein
MRVELVSNGLPQYIIVVDQLPAIVGSSPDADVCIDVPGINRYHCMIDAVSGVLVVSDLVSRGGTFVNESKIDESPVMPGDALRMGIASFDVQYERGRVTLGSGMECEEVNIVPKERHVSQPPIEQWRPVDDYGGEYREIERPIDAIE